MFCIYCFHKKTQTTNTRSAKKRPETWRRRYCPSCGHTFSTYEIPKINLSISTTGDAPVPFSLGKLHLTIAECFSHNPSDSGEVSLELAKTIEQALYLTNEPITPTLLATTIHTTLQAYDPVAALQYAAKHRLVTSTRKRGRPSTRYVS